MCAKLWVSFTQNHILCICSHTFKYIQTRFRPLNFIPVSCWNPSCFSHSFRPEHNTGGHKMATSLLRLGRLGSLKVISSELPVKRFPRVWFWRYMFLNISMRIIKDRGRKLADPRLVSGSRGRGEGTDAGFLIVTAPDAPRANASNVLNWSCLRVKITVRKMTQHLSS